MVWRWTPEDAAEPRERMNGTENFLPLHHRAKVFVSSGRFPARNCSDWSPEVSYWYNLSPSKLNKMRWELNQKLIKLEGGFHGLNSPRIENRIHLLLCYTSSCCHQQQYFDALHHNSISNPSMQTTIQTMRKPHNVNKINHFQGVTKYVNARERVHKIVRKI